MRKRKVRINREKFTDFLAGVAMAVIIDACFIAILLKL